MEKQVVAGRYRVGRKIGSGAFGQIYVATDMHTNEQVAIKFESVRVMHPHLYFESKVYDYLRGGYGIPKARWYGKAGPYYALVLDLLGDNIETLFKRCGGRFSLKTVLMLADQMLSVVEYLHSKSFVHRDIKPDNFVIGLGSRASQVYMIDLGLAKRYRDINTHQHFPYTQTGGPIGTAKYMSINAHDGIELTRRDDLESLGYCFINFLRGSLPWDRVSGSNSTTFFKRIRDKKINTRIEALCQGLPSEFKTYFRYCHALRYDEAPDYTYLKKLFRDLAARQGYRYDNVFDWMKSQGSSRPQSSAAHHRARPSSGHPMRQNRDEPGCGRPKSSSAQRPSQAACRYARYDDVESEQCSRKKVVQCKHKKGAWNKLKKFFG